MSLAMLEGLERRLKSEPDNTFLKARIKVVKERLGLSIKPREAIPPPMVIDYLLAGNATATVQWLVDEEKRHLTFSIKQHLLKKGKKVVGRVPKWDVWYRKKTQLYSYLYQLRRGESGLEVHNFENPPEPLTNAAYVLNKVFDGNTGYSVFHDGSCGCCGLELTHPESIQRGIGPLCFGNITTDKRTDLC